MAFKSAAVPIGNTDTTIYECPPALEAAGKIMVSNPTGTARTLTVKFFDASAGTTTIIVSRLVAANSDYPLPIPPSAEQGDRFVAVGDQAGLVAAFTFNQSDLSPAAKGFSPKGAFNPAVTYAMGDTVSDAGSSYVSRVDANLGNVPAASTAQWQLIAAMGEAGAPGLDGADGVDGQDGEGNVNGPASAVNNRFAVFDGNSGKIIKDSGFSDTSFATAAQGAKADSALQPGTTALDSRYYTEAEVDAAISAAVSAAVGGVSKRSTVRVATTANITIATALNAGDTLNGVTLANGERVLVKNQTAPAENGVYIVGATPVRDPLFDTFPELAGSVLVVQEGSTDGDSLWFCTSNADGALGTTAVNFTKLTVTGELLAANNLSDLPAPATARSNLGLATVAATGAYGDLSGRPANLTSIAGLTLTGNTGKAVVVNSSSDGFELGDAAGGGSEWTQIGSDVVISSPVANVTLTGIGGYRDLLVEFVGLSHNNGSTTNLRVAASADGTSFYTASTNIAVGVAASDVVRGSVIVLDYTRDVSVLIPGGRNYAGIDAANVTVYSVQAVGGISAVRVFAQAGSLDAGTIKVFGR